MCPELAGGIRAEMSRLHLGSQYPSDLAHVPAGYFAVRARCIVKSKRGGVVNDAVACEVGRQYDEVCRVLLHNSVEDVMRVFCSAALNMRQ